MWPCGQVFSLPCRPLLGIGKHESVRLECAIRNRSVTTCPQRRAMFPSFKNVFDEDASVVTAVLLK